MSPTTSSKTSPLGPMSPLTALPMTLRMAPVGRWHKKCKLRGIEKITRQPKQMVVSRKGKRERERKENRDRERQRQKETETERKTDRE